MVEKHNKKLKAKGKAGMARSKAASGGPTGRVPKKGRSEKFCQQYKAHGGPYQTHNTLDCRCYDSNGKPLEAAAGKPIESKKPFKKSGGNKACRPCLRLVQKARRKPLSLRSVRSAAMTPVTVPTVNRELGMATQDLV